MNASHHLGTPVVGAARWLLLLAVLAWSAASGTLVAQPRILPEGAQPADSRLGPLKDLDGYFPFLPSPNRDAWEHRAEQVRQRLLVSLGLWPLPARTPLNPVIHGRLDAGDYTVEKVFFESAPGFFVTGNLYRPARRSGRSPGVLCPHGHWTEGRFLDAPASEIQREIGSGAEKLESAARSVLQARCVQLARMGCVVFHYDMLGYADSQQIPMAVAHQFARQRPEMNVGQGWGLFSPQAESHAQSVMGLQAWNGIRALDFLCGLEDVDPKRIAVTGASGGGTQTFILGAIDPRPAVVFPAVMVSTAMQGGCTCENTCGLRVGTGNVEFAALFAPKPLGMTAANDWTRELPAKGYPELGRHYAMLGVPDRVSLTPLLQFGHNYNLPSRTAMYAWLNRHLRLGWAEPIEERDFRWLSRQELSVWDAAHPQPPGGPEFERSLLRWFHTNAQDTIQSAGEKPRAFRGLAGPAAKVLFGFDGLAAETPSWKETARANGLEFVLVQGLLQCPGAGVELPVVRLEPHHPKGGMVLWLTREGKRGLWEDGSTLKAGVKALLDGGTTVVGVDLFMQGEFLGDSREPVINRRVKNPREAAAYTWGYNSTLFAQRVQDVLRVTRWLAQPTSMFAGRTRMKPEVGAVGLDGAGAWLAAARAVEPRDFGPAAIDTEGFRFGQVTAFDSPEFLPGGAKYLDLPGLVALGAPGRLWLAGEGSSVAQLPSVIKAAYRSSRKALTLEEASADEEAGLRVARWLLAH